MKRTGRNRRLVKYATGLLALLLVVIEIGVDVSGTVYAEEPETVVAEEDEQLKLRFSQADPAADDKDDDPEEQTSSDEDSYGEEDTSDKESSVDEGSNGDESEDTSVIDDENGKSTDDENEGVSGEEDDDEESEKDDKDSDEEDIDEESEEGDIDEESEEDGENEEDPEDEENLKDKKGLVLGAKKALPKKKSPVYLPIDAAVSVTASGSGTDYKSVNTFTAQTINLDKIESDNNIKGNVSWSFKEKDADNFFSISGNGRQGDGTETATITPKDDAYLAKDTNYHVIADVSWDDGTTETMNEGNLPAKGDDADPQIGQEPIITGDVYKYNESYQSGWTPTLDKHGNHVQIWSVNPANTSFEVEVSEGGNIQSGIKSVEINYIESESGASGSIIMPNKKVTGGKEYYSINASILIDKEITSITVTDNAGKSDEKTYDPTNQTGGYIAIVNGVRSSKNAEDMFAYEVKAGTGDHARTYDGTEEKDRYFSYYVHDNEATIRFDNVKDRLDMTKNENIDENSFEFKRLLPSEKDLFKGGSEWKDTLDSTTLWFLKRWEGEYKVALDEEGEHKYKLSFEYSDVATARRLSKEVGFIVDNTKPEIIVSYGHLGDEFESPAYTNQPVTLTVYFNDRYLSDEADDAKDRFGVVVHRLDENGEESKEFYFTGITEDEAAGWHRTGNGYSLTILAENDAEYWIEKAFAYDKAGNYEEINPDKHFIVDRTEPVITLTFDPENAVARNFFNTNRTASIKIEENHLNADEVKIEIESMDIDGNEGTLAVVNNDWEHGGKEHKKTITFNQDGKYRMRISASDMAGNKAESRDSGEFIIDRTGPQITVHFDNNSVRNEIYYNNARTATISIKDFGLNESTVAVITSSEAGTDMTPARSAFSGEGTTQTATIPFREDGRYAFSVKCEDYAGNQSGAYSIAAFVIDATEPEIHFDRVENYSANKGDVAPVIHYQDANIDADTCVVTVKGANRGEVMLPYDGKAIANGMSFAFENVPKKKKNDDLYTMTAQVTDLAGNTTEQELVFSVNRYGSVYVIGEATKQAYVKEPEAVTITEINVDTLTKKEVSVSRDGDVEILKQGSGYTLRGNGTDETWKSFTYTIPRSYFKNDGHYAVKFASVDRATNAQDNRSRDAAIDFAVDRTAPSIVVSGLAHGADYEEDAHRFMVNVTDNMALKDLQVFFDDKLERAFDSVVLKRTNGTQEISIPASEKETAVRIVSSDEAGNTSEVVYNRINVMGAVKADSAQENGLPVTAIADSTTPLASMTYMANVPWGAIATVAVLLMITGYVYYDKKKKQKTQ